MVRVRFLVTVLLLVVAGTALAATQPPKTLRLVGDHWTPYNPPDPASFPAGARVHIIEKGDTLWGLATRFYGDPYLWPQLWENNTYITDAHWIYPGDPLLIEGETTSAEVAEDEVSTEVAGDEGEMVATLSAEQAPVALGWESDIYCFGYLGAENESLPNRITSFEDYELKWVERAVSQDTGVTDNDIVFVNLEEPEAVMAGETYLVVQPAQLVPHPETGEVIGRHYDYRGRVRILCINGSQATAVVVQSCKPIQIGDAIRPIPEHPIPLARLTEMADTCTPPSGRSTGFIVNAQDFREALGEGNVVEVNLGRDDLIQPGDFLTVYRDSPVPGNPRIILGEVGILTAEANTATGRIIRMRNSMRIGDRVEIK